jgi:hypothetical protein
MFMGNITVVQGAYKPTHITWGITLQDFFVFQSQGMVKRYRKRKHRGFLVGHQIISLLNFVSIVTLGLQSPDCNLKNTSKVLGNPDLVQDRIYRNMLLSQGPV